MSEFEPGIIAGVLAVLISTILRWLIVDDEKDEE